MPATATAPRAPAQGAGPRRESEGWLGLYREGRFVERRRRVHGGRLERLGVFELPRGARVLDLCSGTGEALDTLHEAAFQRLHGADLHPELARACAARHRVVAADAAALPYREASFDAVVCLHALHHLGPDAHLEGVLDEVARVLVPGGLLHLVDHPDAPAVHIAFALLSSPLALATSLTRRWRRQLALERVELAWWFSRGARLPGLLAERGFATVARRRDPFFFYLTACRSGRPPR